MKQAKELTEWPFNVFVMVFLMLGSFLAGMELSDTLNPYEQCKHMYDTPEDISECVWIKENP